MKPRIAIPVPTSFDLAYNRLNAPSYADAVRACAGEPVEFALDLPYAELAQLTASCDGILLPGSPADVDPAKYGQIADDATAPSDPGREAVDEFLLADAFALRKPIFGICFGTQMLNVFRGGTLIQDLTVMPVNHSAGRSIAVAHSVSVLPGSLLDTLVDHAELQERLPVNSSHHQAAGIAGDGLVVTARCSQDAVAEAIELERADGHFVLGVQWHPERTFDFSSSSKQLFCRFVDQSAQWRAAVAAPGTVSV